MWLASLIFSSTAHSHTELLGTYNYQKSNHVNMVATNTAIWLVKLMLQKPCRFLSILVLWHTVVYMVGLATPTIINPLHTSILDSSWASHIPRLHCTWTQYRNIIYVQLKVCGIPILMITWIHLGLVLHHLINYPTNIFYSLGTDKGRTSNQLLEAQSLQIKHAFVMSIQHNTYYFLSEVILRLSNNFTPIMNDA